MNINFLTGPVSLLFSTFCFTLSISLISYSREPCSGCRISLFGAQAGSFQLCPDSHSWVYQSHVCGVFHNPGNPLLISGSKVLQILSRYELGEKTTFSPTKFSLAQPPPKQWCRILHARHSIVPFVTRSRTSYSTPHARIGVCEDTNKPNPDLLWADDEFNVIFGKPDVCQRSAQDLQILQTDNFYNP